MKSFRGSGAHARVMPRLFEWCDEAAYAHWTVPDGEIPDWLQAYEHFPAKAASRESLIRQTITVSGASPNLASSRWLETIKSGLGQKSCGLSTNAQAA